MNTLLFDDKLEVIAEKTMTDGTGRKLNLNEDWRNSSQYARDNSGEVIIYSYWNGRQGAAAEYIKPSEIDNMKNKSEWQPCIERVINTNIPDVFIRTRGNHFFIRMCKLSTSGEARLLSSRYRTAVDIVHDIRPEVINYKNRGGSEKAFLESSRNIIKRNFRLYEYEYDVLILNKELGKKLFNELSGTCQAEYCNTLYLKGFDAKLKKQGGTSVKIYDHGLLHEGIPGLYKLEVTLRAAAFRKLGLSIADMTIQEVCINRLKAEVMTELLKLKGGEVLQEVQLQLFREDNILSRIIRLEEKTKDYDRGLEEIADIKKQLAEIRRAR